MRTSGSRRLVTTQQTLHTLITELKAELGEGYGLVIDEVPALDTIYPHLASEKAEDAFEPYPAPAVAAKPEDMQLYLHSSGSTGFPKAIGHTRASIQGWTKLGGSCSSSCCCPRAYEALQRASPTSAASPRARASPRTSSPPFMALVFGHSSSSRCTEVRSLRCFTQWSG